MDRERTESALSAAVTIAQVTAEHHHDGLGVSVGRPRLSWRFNGTTTASWRQTSYEAVITRGTDEERVHVASSQSVLVPWPSARALASCEAVVVHVRAHGEAGQPSTPWATLRVEAAFLTRTCWTAHLISGPPPAKSAAADTKTPARPRKPFRVRAAFHCHPPTTAARLYATAHGLYEVEINGKRVGDHVLTPGWQSYQHRLHYQTYDVGALLQDGENVIGAYVAEGWFAGRLGVPSMPNLFGDRLGFLGQLSVDGVVVCATDASWEYVEEGPLLEAGIYDGEVYDASLDDPQWSTVVGIKTGTGTSCEVLPFPTAELVAPDAPPVRRVAELAPVAILTTPAGKTVVDFGQNMAGWVRLNRDFPAAKGTQLVLRHAEVLDGGELGTRPLRTAKARDIIRLSPTRSVQGHEPRFTFHGFRYAQIDGLDADVVASLTPADFTAVAISTDLRRTGTFASSHPLLNRLHANAVWSMRSNFVSLPTDCPQRDERLGWTGDLQVFAPTASFLFDTTALLTAWLADVAHEQRATGTGIVPLMAPAVPIGNLDDDPDGHAIPPGDPRGLQFLPMAVWGDCVVLTPRDLYAATGDVHVLAAMWDSMRLWLDRGIPRGPDRLWKAGTDQFGDWLDPREPPDRPGHGPTDPLLVANAYLVHVTDAAAKIAAVLSRDAAETQNEAAAASYASQAARYADDAARLRARFRHLYVTPAGRIVADTQTAYALALRFGLLDTTGAPGEVDTARDRLAGLTRAEAFRITTGFAGTPLILPVLAAHGLLPLAYRMLEETGRPSWLYPVTMGATTIWERWDALQPDGSLNPGVMTSFNHYALGSVCAFLHESVAGLAPAAPGWRRARVEPRPGGSLRHAAASFDSPYGPYAVRWVLSGRTLRVVVTVPPNGEADVILPHGKKTVVGSGVHRFETSSADLDA